ncbi:MAG: zinc-ribbon domain-containing protein [Myxococcales bacterium]
MPPPRGRSTIGSADIPSNFRCRYGTVPDRMEVRCDRCQARYRVDDSRVGPKGLAMRCGKCGNTFRLLPDGTISKISVAKPAAPPDAAARSVPTPGSATPLSTPVASSNPPAERGGDTVVFQAGPSPALAREPAAEPLPKPAQETPAAIVEGLARDPAPRRDIVDPPAPPAPPAPEERKPEPKAEIAPEPQPGPAAAPPSPSPARRPPRSIPMEHDRRWSAGPPRALVVGTVAVLVGLLVVVGALVVWKKGHRSPPRAAVEALERAKAAAEKDSLAALAEAETQATSAIDAARSGFPAAYAELAEIDVAWADALSDEASYWNDRATFASRAGDERARQDADGKASARQDEAKGRLRQAFEAAIAGTRVDPRSKDAAVALADYYRAAGSRTNMELELKKATDLGADPARISFVQGADLLGQDDGAQRAIEKLMAAASGAPASARSRFRLALAYLKAQRTSEARKELEETLRLSPAHERAKLTLESLADRAETRDGKRQ